jgi:murein DD-endopeptidase MepM/ murein hydrolase activator NlpD
MAHTDRGRRMRGQLVIAVGSSLACGEPAAPEPAPQLASAPLSDPATPSAPDRPPATAEPEASNAFALPGLREHAPAPHLGWPTESVHITSSFGWRVDPVTGLGTRLHRGLDLRGAPGDLVLSIGAGTVAFVGHDPLLGNLVVVDHGEGLESFYGHLSDVLVVTDVAVDRGAAIGLVGNTGRSAAPHLHLTIKLDGVAIDPLELIGEPLHRPKALATPLAALEQDAPAPDPPPGHGEQTPADGTPAPVPPRSEGSDAP